MGAQRCKGLNFDNTAPSVFPNCSFDEERTFLKDMSQKKKSNFSALEETAGSLGFRVTCSVAGRIYTSGRQ